MNGLLLSIKSFVQRLSPLDSLVSFSRTFNCFYRNFPFRKDGFHSFKTNVYKLNYYETPTGLKFILNTDPQVGNIRDTLHQLYSNVSFIFIKKISPIKRTIKFSFLFDSTRFSSHTS